MSIPSPLRAELLRRNAELAPYGPPDAGVEVVQTFGPVELEYASLRTACVLIDQPYRASVVVTGADRVDFLNRMLTQDVRPLASGGRWVESFWLSRKGRIEADVRAIGVADRVILDVDVHASAGLVASLSAYLFAEDAAITPMPTLHRMALIGPRAHRLLSLVCDPWTEIAEGEALETRVAGRAVVLDRGDALGVASYGLLMESGDAPAVFEKLCELGMPAGQGAIGEENAGLQRGEGSGEDVRLRLAGWHAYNIARIESGEPVFYLDFGPTSLPAETGVIERRVSFKKGCYLGQEIVARMQSLGHPKVTLVALRVGSSHEDPQPVTGSELLAAGEAVGAVTSSTLSPMLSGQSICLGTVRWEHRTPGTNLIVRTDEGEVVGVVQDGLRFVK